MPDRAPYSSAPLKEAFAITPSDTTVYDPPIRGIYIGGAGNVTIQNEAGVNTLITAPTAGLVLPVFARQVRATGTTATALVGGW